MYNIYIYIAKNDAQMRDFCFGAQSSLEESSKSLKKIFLKKNLSNLFV